MQRRSGRLSQCWKGAAMFHYIGRLAAVVIFTVASMLTAQAACSFGRCKTAVYAKGAHTTKFGAISGNAHLTPYGVTSGHQTSYGVSAGHQTSYGVSGGHQTSYGVSAGHQTSYGVSGGHQTSYGVTSGHQTSFGVIGAGCRQTAYGVSCSDIRMKRDVAVVGRLDNGLPLYRFRYLWSRQVFVGVMAQDVAMVIPQAVMVGADGYLRVDYAQLGTHLQTWDEWQATRLKSARDESAL